MKWLVIQPLKPPHHPRETYVLACDSAPKGRFMGLTVWQTEQWPDAAGVGNTRYRGRPLLTPPPVVSVDLAGDRADAMAYAFCALNCSRCVRIPCTCTPDPVPADARILNPRGSMLADIAETTRRWGALMAASDIARAKYLASRPRKVAQFPGDSCDCKWLCSCVQNSD